MLKLQIKYTVALAKDFRHGQEISQGILIWSCMLHIVSTSAIPHNAAEAANAYIAYYHIFIYVHENGTKRSEEKY